jgi:hypothetical protein
MSFRSPQGAIRLSFFDEADEPTSPAPSRQPRRRPPPGRRPPTAQQAIRTRRAVAVVALLLVAVLLAIGIHSCQVSQRTTALKDYNAQVYSLIGQSDTSGKQLFTVLSSRSRNATALYTEISRALQSAQAQLNRAQAMSVPGEMQTAHSNLVWALTMRRDGIRLIGNNVQQALGTSDRAPAISQIAGGTAHFYASDVFYKYYAVPEMVAALRGAGIAVGGLGGEAINGGQFLSDLAWLSPALIAQRLGVTLPHSAQYTPGLHGHSLNSVGVGGSQLVQGATNYVASTPPPTFTLSVTNGGHFDQYNVVCKVSVTGLSDTGRATIAQTTPGQTTTCQVTLPTAPPAGTYNVTAEIAPVPLETDTTNNYLTFPVRFTG